MPVVACQCPFEFRLTKCSAWLPTLISKKMFLVGLVNILAILKQLAWYFTRISLEYIKLTQGIFFTINWAYYVPYSHEH